MPEPELKQPIYRTGSAAASERKEYYTWEDLKKRDFRYEDKLGDPGKYPYTRGPFQEMYRMHPWIINLHSGYGLPEDSNQRLKRLIQYGAEGITVRVDLPTQMGIDSDHGSAAGKVGQAGVAIDSLEDMEILFAGVEIDRLSEVGMTGNSIGPIAFAFFQALAEKRGLKEAKWALRLQNDVIAEYANQGPQIVPLKSAIRLATDLVKYCAQKKLLHVKPLTVDGAQFSGAGVSWEIAFAMCDAMVYIDHLLASGMNIDEIAPMFRLFLSVGKDTIDLFEEVAKARAARRLWARLLQDRYGAQAAESKKIQQTAFVLAGATAEHPINNIARIALGARAALLGGMESMHTAGWDESFVLPSEAAVQIAIQTQQVLRYESGSVFATADPLGGSYFLEDLTDRIEEEVLAKLKVIEDMGGTMAAVEKGFYQQQRSAGILKKQEEIQEGKRIQVGVNFCRGKEEKSHLGECTDNPDAERKKVEGLNKLRQERNQENVRETLERLREAAKREDNLLPPILAAVKAYATIGEICGQLKEVLGEYSAGRME